MLLFEFYINYEEFKVNNKINIIVNILSFILTMRNLKLFDDEDEFNDDPVLY